MILRAGAEYFNPDEATKRILDANPATTPEEANNVAWHEGRRLLERAIKEKLNFAFETTLGGNTIVALLDKALSMGIEVRIWYAGLNSPELHIARVRSRVARGGHDIPEAKIRERYSQSRLNLIRLLSRLTEVLVYDNSADADPHTGIAPEPTLILRSIQGKIKNSCDPSLVPDWAKPIWMAAMKSLGHSGRR
jgi:predicted ABC-type ATPase